MDPSPRVFGRVLGLLRTGATLKSNKLLKLEISTQEMADLVGYSKATVEAALRWLGSGPIEYRGEQVSRGLGLVHRGRRTAWAYLKGQLQRVYRTSKLVLTMLGQVLLGLGDADAQRQKDKQQARARAWAVSRSNAPKEKPVHRREQEHIQGSTADGGGDPDDKNAVTDEVGRFWLKKIQNSL
ncbi:hypothetical protein ACFL6C_12450 [Myxococcota bacterium]